VSRISQPLAHNIGSSEWIAVTVLKRGVATFAIIDYFNRLFTLIMRLIAIPLLAFVMSCTKQDTADQLFPQEEHAIAIASAKCQCSPEMPWLRDMIRQAESDVTSKGVIYAIEHSNGVAFLHQPWVSSCYGCLVFDCDGKALKPNGGLMNEIIGGAREENIIYTSH
jgi:hypothetical protein